MHITPNAKVCELFLTVNELSKADTNNTGIITAQKLLAYICNKANISMDAEMPLKEIDRLAKRFLVTVKNELHNPLVSSTVNAFVVLELNREALNPATAPEPAKRMRQFASALNRFLAELDTALLEGNSDNALIALETLNRMSGTIDGFLPVKIPMQCTQLEEPVSSQSTEELARVVARAQNG